MDRRTYYPKDIITVVNGYKARLLAASP
jgi:hypothetical protein